MPEQSKELRARQQHARMTQTPIPRLILSLAIPTIVSMLVTTIYNTADTWFVAQLGTGESAGVGIFFPIMAIIQAFGFTFGQGAGSQISRLLGRHQLAQASERASSALFASLVVGGLIALTGLLVLDPLLHLIGADASFIHHARDYARIVLVAAPLLCASFVMNNLLRAEGLTLYSMIGLSAGSILNIALDPLLIFVFDMGVAGAALATALSSLVSFSILLGLLRSRLSTLTVAPRHVSRRPSLYLQMLRLGMPSLTRQGLASISMSLMNNRAAALGGVAAVAALTIVGRVTFLILALMLGLGQGYQPVVGYNYGFRHYRRVRESFRFTMLTGFLLEAAVAVLLIAFAPDIIRLFRDDPEVVRIGAFAMRLQAAVLPLLAPNVATNMLLQSTGHAGAATLLSACRQGIFLIPLLLILPPLLGLNGVLVSQTGADLLTLLTTLPFIVRFFRRLPRSAPEDEAGSGEPLVTEVR